MITFLHCQDRFCRDCVSKYFSDTIKDRSIKNLTCMLCGKPDDLDTDSAAATEYFNNLDIMASTLCSDSIGFVKKRFNILAIGTCAPTRNQLTISLCKSYRIRMKFLTGLGNLFCCGTYATCRRRLPNS